MTESVQIQLIASITSVALALIAAIISLINMFKINAVHKTINSGKTIELAASRELGNLEGRKAEQEKNS